MTRTWNDCEASFTPKKINIKVTDLDELSLDDVSLETKEHILKLVGEGFTSGEVCEFDADDNETRGSWKMTDSGIKINLNN